MYNGALSYMMSFTKKINQSIIIFIRWALVWVILTLIPIVLLSPYIFIIFIICVILCGCMLKLLSRSSKFGKGHYRTQKYLKKNPIEDANVKQIVDVCLTKIDGTSLPIHYSKIETEVLSACQQLNEVR